MNRKLNNSYEGFRRKNSLKSEEAPGLTSPNQQPLTRIKSKDHLEELQNLSSQLNEFRQRSLSCNNKKEDISYPSTYFGQVKSPQPMITKPKTNLNPVPELAVQYRSLKDVEMGSPSLRRLNSKQHKINGFNQFHIIEEDFNSNEDQFLDTIVPVTIAQTPPTLRGTEKKHLTKTHELKNQNYHKPLISHRASDNGISKRDKIKQDITDIQKMQKQLDHHMKKKEPTLKTSMNVRSSKDLMPKQSGMKQETIKQCGRTTQLYTNLAHNKIGLEPKYNRTNIKTKTQNVEKGEMSKSVILEKDIEKQKPQTFNSQKKQLMVATKMITVKEKQGLIDQLLSLKEIIDKNQICSNNLPQINAKLLGIQELLTR